MTDLLLPRDLPLWHDARPYLDVRNNDEHTLVAYGVAQMLLKELPEAERRSCCRPSCCMMSAGKRCRKSCCWTPSAGHPSAPIWCATTSFTALKLRAKFWNATAPKAWISTRFWPSLTGMTPPATREVLEDAVVKDADKGWRTTPHGMRIIRGWYGWSVADYIDMVTVVSNPRLLTAPGRAMAEGFTAALRAEQTLSQYLEQT